MSGVRSRPEQLTLLDQYIAMTLFLLGAKRAFDAFAAQQPSAGGRITVDFNQFVYAASKTR